MAGDEGRRYAFPGTSGKTGGHIAQGSLSVLMGAKTTNKSNPRMGICEYLGLNDVTPHDLRRTCAKLCRAGGGELEQIQLLLGHASVQTTERYLGRSAIDSDFSFA